MAYNFRRGDLDQLLLLPPDPRDWLPADHLAWFVRDVVDQLDLGPFLPAYRPDGHGHPAYDPKLLLGVLLYAYAMGMRSSRQIQRRCTEDLAFRVLAGNQFPDHVTIARFRVRHQHALAGFLVASLKLCAAAGLVRLGVVALDGTKVATTASHTEETLQEKIEAEVSPRSCANPPRPTNARTGSTARPVGRVPGGAGLQGRPAGAAAAGQGPPGGRGRRAATPV
jgi:transposase